MFGASIGNIKQNHEARQRLVENIRNSKYLNSNHDIFVYKKTRNWCHLYNLKLKNERYIHQTKPPCIMVAVFIKSPITSHGLIFPFAFTLSDFTITQEKKNKKINK